MTSPAMLLQQAVRLLGLGRLAVWPATLTVWQLASLQYPAQGTADERRQAAVNRRAFSGLVARAVESGALAAEKLTKTTSAPPASQCRQANGGLGSPEWLAEFQPVRSGGAGRVAVEVIVVLRPQPVADWLAIIEENPSELVSAWLAANHEARATDSRKAESSDSPPDKWSRGLKRIAWDAAVTLTAGGNRLAGKALLSEIAKSDAVKASNGSVIYQGIDASLKRGEVSATDKTVTGDWRQQLGELLNSSSPEQYTRIPADSAGVGIALRRP